MQKLLCVLNGFEVQEREAQEIDLDFIELFLSSKQVEGCTPKTLNQYRYELNRFLNKIKVSVNQITVFHIRKYFSDRLQAGTSERTLDNERHVFSSFFGWLSKENLIQHNPCANLKKIKYPKVVRKPLSEVELEKLKESCKSLRDRAIMSLFLSSGCRVGELHSINRSDIDLEKKEVIVMGKGNKERVLYFDDVTALMLKRYLDTRKDDLEPLFLSRLNTRLQDGSIRRNLKCLAKAAGVEKVHPHRFRRTMATNLIDHGMSIQEVAHLLGHEKIDTTMNYVYISESNVKNNYNKYM